MSTFKLDPASGFLDLSNGTLKILSDPNAEIRQKIAIRLQFFKGEWFLDQNVGVPYFQSILIKNPNLPAVQSIYREAIITVPGVSDLQNFTYTFNNVTRLLSVSFAVITDTSQVLDFNTAFVIGSSP